MTKFGTAGLALAGILAVTAASVTDASAQWRDTAAIIMAAGVRASGSVPASRPVR